MLGMDSFLKCRVSHDLCSAASKIYQGRIEHVLASIAKFIVVEDMVYLDTHGRGTAIKRFLTLRDGSEKQRLRVSEPGLE